MAASDEQNLEENLIAGNTQWRLPLKNEDSEQIKSFIRGQVDNLLKRTRAHAETDAQQAEQVQDESVEVPTWKR